MSLSHCIHQTLNSKASTRFHSGGLQQSLTLILNTFLFGVIIPIANIPKRPFSSKLAAKLRNRLLVHKKPMVDHAEAAGDSVTQLQPDAQTDAWRQSITSMTSNSCSDVTYGPR